MQIKFQMLTIWKSNFFVIILICFFSDIVLIQNIYFNSLPDLQSLQLQANSIKKLNKGLSCLRKLEYLRLDQNDLESISSQEISPCVNLIYLNVGQNKIESLNVS